MKSCSCLLSICNQYLYGLSLALTLAADVFDVLLLLYVVLYGMRLSFQLLFVLSLPVGGTVNEVSPISTDVTYVTVTSTIITVVVIVMTMIMIDAPGGVVIHDGRR